VKILFSIALVLVFSFVAYSQQDCPADRVCLTREAALTALQNADKVVALEKENATLTQALNDLKAEVNKMRVEYAEKVGENTALKQNAVSDRALIEILIKYARPKKIGLNLF
jgi:cell division protein FtsB